jgi:phosphopantothenate synthetase
LEVEKIMASSAQSTDEVIALLSSLEEGQTICSDLTLVERGTWSASLKRFLSGDGRQRTVQIIDNAIRDYCQQKKACVYLTASEVEQIHQVCRGLERLATTYAEDSKIRQRLDEIQQEMTKSFGWKLNESESESSELLES